MQIKVGKEDEIIECMKLINTLHELKLVVQLPENHQPKVEADNTNRGLNNSRNHAKTEFNNCFIIQLYNYKCKSP